MNRPSLTSVVIVAALALGPAACTPAPDAGDRAAGDHPAGAAGSPEAGSKDENTAEAAIVSRVQQRFAADPAVNAHKIEVVAEDGKVTLKGSVKTKAEYDRAAQLAGDTEGVTQVNNALQFDPGGKHPGDHHDDNPK
jgi:hypothetical protein